MNWERLESATLDPELTEGLEARLGDPAWLLARQCQTGEFRGEDAANPLFIQLEARSVEVDRVVTAEGAEAALEADTPLEPLVERAPVRRGPGGARVAAELGLILLTALARVRAARALRDGLRERYPLTLAADDGLDPIGRRRLELLAAAVARRRRAGHCHRRRSRARRRTAGRRRRAAIRPPAPGPDAGLLAPPDLGRLSRTRVRHGLGSDAAWSTPSSCAASRESGDVRLDRRRLPRRAARVASVQPRRRQDAHRGGLRDGRPPRRRPAGAAAVPGHAGGALLGVRGGRRVVRGHRRGPRGSRSGGGRRLRHRVRGRLVRRAPPGPGRHAHHDHFAARPRRLRGRDRRPGRRGGRWGWRGPAVSLLRAHGRPRPGRRAAPALFLPPSVETTDAGRPARRRSLRP